MKFGGCENPEDIDFKLPEDHPGTGKMLRQNVSGKALSAYVGCAKWNK